MPGFSLPAAPVHVPVHPGHALGIAKHALLNVLLSPGHPQNWGGSTWAEVASQYDPRHPAGFLNDASFLMGPRGEFRIPETKTLYANPRLNGPNGDRAFVAEQLARVLNGDGTATGKMSSGVPKYLPEWARKQNSEAAVLDALRMTPPGPSLLAQMLKNHLRAGRN